MDEALRTSGDADDSHEPITRTLQAAARGDPRAAEELLPLAYEELRKLARARLARLPPGQTLQPTALVHEAYLRVAGGADPGWNGRGHFFGAAARAMRQIVVEELRRKATAKRGGGRDREELDGLAIEVRAPDEGVLALDEALDRLAVEDPRARTLVELRFFAGLTAEEAAAALGVSLRTVEREWRYARAWLRAELGAGGLGEALDG